MRCSSGADVIDTLSRTPARELLYDFSAPYATLDVMLFFHDSITGIVDAVSSKGFIIGVKAGDLCIEKLRQQGIVQFRTYASYEALIRGPAPARCGVFCMNQRPAEYACSVSALRPAFAIPRRFIPASSTGRCARGMVSCRV